jgi:hypothetical protein
MFFTFSHPLPPKLFSKRHRFEVASHCPSFWDIRPYAEGKIIVLGSRPKLSAERKVGDRAISIRLADLSMQEQRILALFRTAAVGEALHVQLSVVKSSEKHSRGIKQRVRNACSTLTRTG